VKNWKEMTWAVVAWSAATGALLLPSAAQAKVVPCRDHLTSLLRDNHIVAHNLPTGHPCRLADQLAHDLVTIADHSHKGTHGIWIGNQPFSEAGFSWTFSYRVIRRDKFGNDEGDAITIDRSGTSQRVTYNQYP
jgi:hypothetical protein